MARRSLYPQQDEQYNQQADTFRPYMFEGVPAMSARRNALRNQRSQNIYMNRMRAGLEDPYGEEEYPDEQQQPNMIQNYIARQQQQQMEQQQQALNVGNGDNPLSRYAFIDGASKPIDMNPEKGSLELLADQYKNYMMDATNPSLVQYQERTLPDGTVTYDEDPNNQFNKDRRVAMSDLKQLFNPNRSSSMRTTEDQLALDNNRAANTRSAIEAKYGYEMEKLNMNAQYKAKLAEQANQLGLDSKVMNQAISSLSGNYSLDAMPPNEAMDAILKTAKQISASGANGNPSATTNNILKSLSGINSSRGKTPLATPYVATDDSQTTGAVQPQALQAPQTQPTPQPTPKPSMAGQSGGGEGLYTEINGVRYPVTRNPDGSLSYVDGNGVRHTKPAR